MTLLSSRPRPGLFIRTFVAAGLVAALAAIAAAPARADAVDAPAAGQEPVPEPAPEPAAPPAPEPAPAPAPEPAPAPAPAIPLPPGGQTTWSNSDGTAPSQAWLDAWRQAANTPSNGQNVLLPWESPSGQVELGQGTAVTGGWSIVDAHGNAGGAIVCGTLCQSGWFPQSFGPDGTPTSWSRVIQLTSPVDGNVFGGSGHYSPDAGWTVPGEDGTYAWDWQTNSRGPCIADCRVAAPAPGDAADPTAPDDGGATMVSTSTSARPAVARPESVQVAQAELATAVRVASSGRFAVRVSSPALTAGDTVRIVVRRGGRTIRAWSTQVPDSGTLVLSAPRSWLGARVTVSEKGRTVGLAFLAT